LKAKAEKTSLSSNEKKKKKPPLPRKKKKAFRRRKKKTPHPELSEGRGEEKGKGGLRRKKGRTVRTGRELLFLRKEWGQSLPFPPQRKEGLTKISLGGGEKSVSKKRGEKGSGKKKITGEKGNGLQLEKGKPPDPKKVRKRHRQ